jgi:hypothetical protein
VRLCAARKIESSAGFLNLVRVLRTSAQDWQHRRVSRRVGMGYLGISWFRRLGQGWYEVPPGGSHLCLFQLMEEQGDLLRD